MHSYLAADTLPLALVISVPLVSLTLLCLLVGSAFCLKRALPAAAPTSSDSDHKKKNSASTTATNSSSSSSSSPLPKLPNVVLNPLAQPSPYATSHLVCIKFIIPLHAIVGWHIFETRKMYRDGLNLGPGLGEIICLAVA